MKRLKFIIFFNISITTTIWLIWYLTVAFTLWELYNPLQWIIDIPTSESKHRFAVLLSYLCYQGCLTVAVNSRYEEIQTENN